MIIYKDLLTNEELFTDSYPIELVDGLYYKVTGKLGTESNKIDDTMFGGNASAEGGGDDNYEDNAKSGVNIVLAHDLQQLPDYDRKEYLSVFKEYAKRLMKFYKENKSDELEDFQKRFAELHKIIKALVKNESFQYYQTKSATGDGMFALLGYLDDDCTPYMVFFKDGIEEEKA